MILTRRELLCTAGGAALALGFPLVRPARADEPFVPA